MRLSNRAGNLEDKSNSARRELRDIFEKHEEVRNDDDTI